MKSWIDGLFQKYPKLKYLLWFSVVRAIYGFIVLGLGYLVTETLGIDFDIKVILLPIALFLLTKRVLRYKKS